MMGTFLAPLSAKIGFGLSAALLIVVGVLWLSLGAEKRHSAKLATRLAQTQAAFDQTVANYRQAAELARAQDAANKARVEKDQSNVSVETLDRYRRELDALRVRYAKATANPGSPGKPPVPSVPDAAGGTDAAAEAGFNCRANALQLRALQDWVKGQAAVDR